MYTVIDYGRMLADSVRVDAYRRALAAVVKPGAIVADLGAGTGFFSLEACRLGAAKVYAIETNDAVALLADAAKRNGFADRIEIIARPSTDVTLPEKVDVLLADLRGVVPLFQDNFAIVADARSRWLAPDGVLLPQTDTVYAAFVESPPLYASVTAGWEGHDVDLRAARLASVNTFHHDRDHLVRPEQVITDGAPIATLRYGDPAPGLVTGEAVLSARRGGTAHGIVLWFDAVLATVGDERIGFTTAPGHDRVYSRGFLPLETPLAVEAGDTLSVELLARRGLGDHVWAWSTTHSRAGSRLTSFRQSTFFGVAAAPGAFARESDGYAPALGTRGKALAAMFDRMDGSVSVADLARDVFTAHPGAFASLDEALDEARRLSRKYG